LTYDTSVQHCVVGPTWEMSWWEGERQKAVVTGRVRVCVRMAYEEMKCCLEQDRSASEKWETCSEVGTGFWQ
jgi:hypothetical protein